MFTIRKVCLILLSAVCLIGCGKDYPSDTGSIKYANRTSPGSKLEVKSVLVPDKMNIIYFYADW